MILVDSSIWIDYLNNRMTPETVKLEDAAARELILIGDLILLEVLQGARTEARALQMEAALRQFDVVPLLGSGLAPKAARNYRRLRQLGITVRKTADLIIGTFCTEHGYALLHADRDFVPMEKHLGLQTV